MKAFFFTNRDFFKSSTFIRISAFLFISLAFFYFGKHWSSDGYQQLIFFNSRQNPLPSSQTQTQTTPTVSLSPNHNKSFDISSLITDTTTQTVASIPPPSDPEPLPTPPPPPPVVQRFGIVDENGTMRDDFEVGDFDPGIAEDWGSENKTEAVEESRTVVKKFGRCTESMREYIPCLDNVEAIRGLESTEKGERFERHCPDKGKGLDCLVPAPKGYRTPIPWPRSRDEMVPDIAFGQHTRVAMDVGCGVASFGAYLLSRNVLTMSAAPKDVHENQVQFALERGVPAMVAALATRRLLYPSQAFDLIHCSRCRINWTRDDGILLLEVNRVLRAGGYFAWAAQPVYKHEPLLEEQWEEMVNLTSRLCWNLVKKEGYIAIWQKPSNNSCYLSREAGAQPPLCDSEDDPDNVWYVDLKACIFRLPDDGAGSNVTTWPARLHNPPDRLQSIQMDAYISRRELFRAESKYWSEIIASYVRVLHWKSYKLRNVLDMRASFGGFAAALIEHQLDCWVLNVVPVSGPNTLPVIYDRGLLGVLHDWCEPFDTYPRTYDLLHAAGLFSIERKRCNVSSIMLEMDRILRPGGRVYIRDSVGVMDELQEIGKAMGWHVALRDTSEGPHASYRILTCDKH
ncbi:probable methyltransferase PMT11 isoform X2 [Rhododendron vialii]|uniref:probable methyltransferase PMT11 isoform X2 n=1 Tax=Rhododendron vialii TaxID=182163 RepID=UPI00265E16E3|nr:probable methyltransferase PMT11 isoform X2 [Rhododendron vialii]